jgi:hypothetical protein
MRQYVEWRSNSVDFHRYNGLPRHIDGLYIRDWIVFESQRKGVLKGTPMHQALAKSIPRKF